MNCTFYTCCKTRLSGDLLMAPPVTTCPEAIKQDLQNIWEWNAPDDCTGTDAKYFEPAQIDDDFNRVGVFQGRDQQPCQHRKLTFLKFKKGVYQPCMSDADCKMCDAVCVPSEGPEKICSPRNKPSNCGWEVGPISINPTQLEALCPLAPPPLKCLSVQYSPTSGYCAGKTTGFFACAYSRTRADKLASDSAMVMISTKPSPLPIAN
jgi:hypothetical protein